MQLKYAVIGCFAGLVALSMYCANPIGGTDTGNPRVSGVLFNKDGSRARNALVRLIPADYNPRSGAPASFDSAVTNDTGMYSFDSLPTNFYNVLGSGSSVVSFQDSVVIVSTTRTIVPSDTLKDPGSLKGVVRLQPTDDCRTVFLIVMGTTLWSVPGDSLGNFSLANLAEGEYRLRVISTLDQYLPLDTVFTIQAGKTTTLLDTIRLRYTGIPIPTGVRLAYDSLKHQVTLAWNRADSVLAKGYCVYRSDVDENTTFEQINRSLITDTVFVDSAMEDSTTYAYKICAVDKGDNKGKLSAGVRVRVGARLLPKIVEYDHVDTVDLGSPLTMTVYAIGSETLSYAWYKRTGDSTYKIPGKTEHSLWIEPAKATDSGVYFCEVSNKYGSDRSGNAHVTINFLPRIESHPQSDTVDFGKQIYLQLGATGAEPLSYAWYKKTGDSIYKIPGMMENVTWIDSAMVTDSGLYFCEVSNPYGSARSNCAHIAINCMPRIVEDLQSDTVDLGSPVWMMVVAGGPELSYVWYKKEADSTIQLANQIENALRIDTVQVSDTGTYFCVVSNSFGSDTSKSARIVVGNSIRIPQITAQPMDTAVMTGWSVLFKVSAKGTPPLTYTWYKNGIEYESQIDDTVLWFSSVTASDSGYYRCIVRNEYGADTSRQITLTVIDGRPVITAQPRDTAVLETRPWSMSVTAAGSGTMSYAWYKTGVTTVKGTSRTLSISSAASTDTGTYYCVVANAFGACTSSVATVSVLPIQMVRNTLKLRNVVYDTVSGRLNLTWYIDTVGFQHAVGITWLQRSRGDPPDGSFFPQPGSAPRVGEIMYTDVLRQEVTYAIDLANVSPPLLYGKEYYFGIWVSKLGEKWSPPTDSSIRYYLIPQPKVVPVVIFKNTDSISAFSGQVILRKVDPVLISVNLRLVEDLPFAGSGLVPVSVAFKLETNSTTPIRLQVGLLYYQGLIPAGHTINEIQVYRYDEAGTGWIADNAALTPDLSGAPVLYFQTMLPDCKYPFVLAIKD
jgi:hypothetical protein